MEAVPAVVEFLDSLTTAALLLAMCTVTPPWFDPPSDPVYAPSCRPAPTVVGSEPRVIPGAETVTDRVAVVNDVKPGAVALTCVVPPPIGSNWMPPPAIVVGELVWPCPIVTVRVCAVPASVVSCATVAAWFVIVTVSGLPPKRTACSALSPVLFALASPIRA